MALRGFETKGHSSITKTRRLASPGSYKMAVMVSPCDWDVLPQRGLRLIKQPKTSLSIKMLL